MPVVGTSPKGQVVSAALRKKKSLKAGAKASWWTSRVKQDTVILRAPSR